MIRGKGQHMKRSPVGPSGGGGGGGGDPFYGNVSLLLHMDGTSGSTSFPDNSPSPKTITAAGGAQVNTSIVKFGTGSVALNGGAELQLPSSSDFILTGDFTIECWIYTTAPGTSQVVFGSNLGGLAINHQIQFYQSGNNTGLFNGSGWNSLPLIGTSANTWYFMVYQRQGTTLSIYQDGQSLGSLPPDSPPATYNFSTGGVGALVGYALSKFQGYIDEVRITKGVARYSSNFTPPTAPFPDF